MVKHPLAVQETWVRFLAWEDALEKSRQCTPVFLPGKPHGQRSLEGTVPEVAKESDRGGPKMAEE